MKLLYIANIRLPTEKAHGLQIMQNCEAFADAGADVTLWTAQRVNTAELRGVANVWSHYGVKSNFGLRRIPCLDLLPLVPGRNDLPARLIFYLQQGTFVLLALLRALFVHADVYYSRDAIVMLALSLIKPRCSLAYEAHKLAQGRSGRWLQGQAVRRVGTVIAVTARLRDDLMKPHHPPHSPFNNIEGEKSSNSTASKFIVAHDGIRRERFADSPAQKVARAALGWPEDAFIVGYAGRLHTMAMDKGVGALVEALAQIEGVALALVGGPDDMAEMLRHQWRERGLPESDFLYGGQVAAERVPTCLSAFDVCAMPLPWTQHFAYHASPMKLFEYMASGRAIVASDLPSTTEVVQHEMSALLYPPGDVGALAAAIRRLRDEPALSSKLAANAHADVLAYYTWDARTQAILKAVTSNE